ncbi:sensor histidine kinase [Agrilactobacillus yilanensis]|uniref:Heme sensor protein HssS n=1 Tax=Agrilactobacillus yilanensis TaxID=2485997 RepID=A0ABW4J6N3_9LACO|nr:HAMP domain-containing sensor histidine kinase [Agrilactobacillus yilanensis]
MIFKRSLSHKVVLWISGILCFSCLIGFLGGNQYYHQQLKPKNDAKITAMAKNIQHFYQQLPQNQRQAYLNSVAQTGYDFAVYTDGQVHYYGSPFRITQLTQSARATVAQNKIYHGIKHYQKGPFVTGFFANDLNNTVGIQLNPHQQLFIRANPNAQFGELRSYMLVIGLITVTLGAFLLVLTAQKRLVRPLKRLTQATQKVAAGNYHTNLTAVTNQDEIGRLTESFQKMTQQLAEVEKSRNEFVANVSHDLQSPLTALKGYADQLQAPTLPPQQQQRYLQIIQQETTRLAELTKELLLLSTLDQEHTLDFQQTLALDQQLKAAIKAFSFQLDQKALFVAAQLPPVTVVGNQELLFQVWQNLLTNSIRYAPEASDLKLTLTQTKTTATITLTNFGPPIDPEVQQHLFERFYQGDTTRQARDHHGLGLAIAYKIVQLHHGTLTVASTQADGTTFKVQLPLK